MNKMFQSDFYGDNQRWFMGIVEDNVDSIAKLNRVRVRIFGIHAPSLAIDDLPWAQVVAPTTETGISGTRPLSLLNGATVYGIFLDGENSQLPLVLGSVPKIESMSARQANRAGDMYGDFPSEQSPEVFPESDAELLGSLNYESTFGQSDYELGVVGNSNPERGFNFFKKQGFTPYQAAGIIGNLRVESFDDMQTGVKSAGSENSYGIAQWNSARAAGNRFGNLQNFANQHGRDWRELTIQLLFIVHELQTVSFYGLKPLLQSTTIRQATFVFEGKFERPNERRQEVRVVKAQNTYNEFQG